MCKPLPARASAARNRALESAPVSSRETACATNWRRIADAALNFPAPTTPVAGARDPLFVLELYHGPTAAFKDFGARFLAECQQRLQPAALRAAVDHFGRHFRRYRGRGRRRFL